MPDDNGSAGYRLDDEERSIVGDCLAKERLSLTRDRFECLVAAIGASMAHFRAMARESTFRDAHDALREMWELSHDDDPQIGVLRARLKNLPRDAIEELGRRAPTVIRRLFCTGIGDDPFDPPERNYARFLEWAERAEGQSLVTALRVMTATGAKMVQGRSRGAGKRSSLRQEPQILGVIRGTGAASNHGGRPRNEGHQSLVMRLALAWFTATNESPKPGRSDKSGFGDLVHSVFQWLDQPQDSAGYALRQFWGVLQRRKRQEPLKDFLTRHGSKF